MCCICRCVSKSKHCKASSRLGDGGAARCRCMQRMLLLLLWTSQGCRLSSKGAHRLGFSPGLHPPASSSRVLAWGYAAAAALIVAANRGLEASCHRLCGIRMVWQKAVPRRCLHALQTQRAASKSSRDSRRGRDACTGMRSKI